MIRKALAAAALGGIVAVSASSASAAVVTVDISVATDEIGITSFDVSGFRFTAVTGVFSMRQELGPTTDYFYFGSTDPALSGAGVFPSQVRIERIGGGVFDLVRFSEINDAAGIQSGLDIQELTSSNGGNIDLYFDVSNPDFAYLLGGTDLPASFQGVTSVTFNELAASFAAYDNFVFRVPDVPAPLTLALLGSGLVMLAGLRRHAA